MPFIEAISVPRARFDDTVSLMHNSTQRFGDRVDNYVKYRPQYPRAVIDFLMKEMHLTSSSVIADIGSGTGISAEMFLERNLVVEAVEPNEPMRAAAESRLREKYSRFHSHKGTSEATGLESGSVDMIVAAQAFHWFEPAVTKKEFQMILKPSGYVTLIWNDRKTTGNSFAEEYESLIHKHGTDYGKVNHKNIDSQKIAEFLGEFRLKAIYNEQSVDLDGLVGRLASSSYLPNIGQIGYEAMVKEAKELFAKHAQPQSDNGLVTIEYETKIYYARW
jgi:SAM-dependent methyltransferase